MPFGQGGGFGGGQGLGGFRGFGGGRSAQQPQIPLPSDEQIKEEEEKLKEKKPWIIELLELPDEFLGGQTFKAALQGDLGQAFFNNPLFQLTDAAGLTDVTKDVTFADVREGKLFDALGIGGQGAEVRDGFANLVINTAGEILSSPVELLFAPFAKVGTAASKLSAGSRGLIKFTDEAIEASGGLVKAVADGKRAMAVFKIPFTKTGYVVQPYKNLDLHIARGLEGTANWLNQVPAVAAARKTLSTTFAAVGNVMNGPTAAATRETIDNSVTKGFADARADMRPFFESYYALTHRAKGRMLDPKILQIVSYATEIGVDGIDDAVEFRRVIQLGPEYAKGQGKLKRLLETGQAEAGVGIAEAGDLVKKARSYDEEAFAEFMERYPTTALFEDSDLTQKATAEYFQAMGSAPRPGIDFRADTRKFGFDPGASPAEKVAGAMSESTTLASGGILNDVESVIPGLPTDIKLGGTVSEGAARRAEIAAGTTAQEYEVIAKSRERSVSLFDEVLSGTSGAVMRETERFEKFARSRDGSTLRQVVDAFGGRIVDKKRLEKLATVSGDEIVNADSVKRLIGEVIETDESEIVSLITNLATDGNKLMEDLGRKDAIEFAIETLSGPYLPRIDNPEVADKINKLMLDATKEHFGKEGISQVQAFMSHRDFFRLTAMEVNELFYEMGSTVTARSPLKKLFEAPTALETSQKTFTYLIEKSGIMDLLKKSDDKDATRLWEFFSANPLNAYVRRLNATLTARKEINVHRELLAPDSNIVLDRGRVTDSDFNAKSSRYSTSQNKFGSPLTPRLVRPNGRSDPTSLEQVGRMALNTDRQAQRLAAKDATKRFIQEDIDAGKITAKAAKDLIDDSLVGFSASARPKSLEELADLDSDMLPIRTLKQTMREIWKEKDNLDLIRQADYLERNAGGALRKEPTELAGAKRGTVRKVTAEETEALARIAHLEEKAEQMRSGLREASSGLGDLRKEIGPTGRGLRSEASKAIDDATKGKFSPDEMSHYIEMMKRWEKDGSLALEEVRANPELYERLVKNSPDAEVVWMDSVTHREIYGKNGVMERLFAPDKLSGHFRIFDEFTQWWKMTTLWFPQTQARNAVTNYAMLAMSGIPPQDLVTAARGSNELSRGMRAALREGDSSILDTLKLSRTTANGVEEIAAHDLYQTLYKFGALDGGYVRDETMMSIGDIAKNLTQPKREAILSRLLDGVIPPIGPLKKVAGDGRSNPIFQTSAAVSDYLDNHARLVGTIARWQSGEELETAVRNVMASSYTPGRSYTAVERGIYGRAIPFYRWTKFAVESQVKAYFERPASVTYWGKLWKAARDGSGIPAEAWDDVVPDFINENFGVPIRKSGGDPSFFLFGSYVPIGEISGIAEAIGGIAESDGASAVDWLGSRSNPAIKTMIEQVTNRSFFTGRDIERFPGENTEMFGITMRKKTANVIRNVRFLNELDRLNVIGLDDFRRIRVGIEANLRGSQQAGSRADTENPLLRAATGAFGPLPRTQGVRIDEEIGFSQGALERERSKIKGQIRKRVEDKRPSAKEDIATLQEDLATIMARLRALEVLEASRKQP